MSFAQCNIFRLREGECQFSELTREQYQEFENAYKDIVRMNSEIDNFFLLKKGFSILKSLPIEEIGKREDKFYVFEFVYTAWLNCFYMWINYHEKKYHVIFNNLKNNYYDQYLEYRLSYYLRQSLTHVSSGVFTFVFDVLKERTSIAINIKTLRNEDINATKKQLAILDEAESVYGRKVDAICLTENLYKALERFQEDIWKNNFIIIQSALDILRLYMPLSGNDCYNTYITFEDGRDEMNVGPVISSFLGKQKAVCHNKRL